MDISKYLYNGLKSSSENVIHVVNLGSAMIQGWHLDSRGWNRILKLSRTFNLSIFSCHRVFMMDRCIGDKSGNFAHLEQKGYTE